MLHCSQCSTSHYEGSDKEQTVPLHPDAKVFMDIRTAAGSRPVTELTVEQARQQSMDMMRLLGPPEAVAGVRDVEAPGPHGNIPIRIYTPAGTGPFPMTIYYHGGGWVLGNLETADIFCRQLTNAAPCVVASVNYRHAPEYKFPVAAEDCYAATSWLAQHANEFGVEPGKIAISGPSAGGNLAAVTALMAAQHGGPAIAAQVLIVPVTNYDLMTTSYQENAEGYGLTRDGMHWFWKHYLADESDGAHPHASPLRATSLAGQPPAFVITAEFDPLRDEGEAYARRLEESGVAVQRKRYDGMIHGYQGPALMSDIAGYLRSVFKA
jgi:acetyl esterase/lipase